MLPTAVTLRGIIRAGPWGMYSALTCCSTHCKCSNPTLYMTADQRLVKFCARAGRMAQARPFWWRPDGRSPALLSARSFCPTPQQQWSLDAFCTSTCLQGDEGRDSSKATWWRGSNTMQQVNCHWFSWVMQMICCVGISNSNQPIYCNILQYIAIYIAENSDQYKIYIYWMEAPIILQYIVLQACNTLQ